MADNTSENMTRVDTGAMREAAASIEGNLKAIKVAYAELMGIYRVISGGFDAQGRLVTLNDDTPSMGYASYEGKWLGSAADAYASALAAVLAKVQSLYSGYEGIPSEINEHAEAYERAHGIAKATAEGIEMCTWAEP